MFNPPPPREAPHAQRLSPFCVVYNQKQVSPWDLIAAVAGKINKSANLKLEMKTAFLEHSRNTRGDKETPLRNTWTLPAGLLRFNATRWSSKVCRLRGQYYIQT